MWYKTKQIWNGKLFLPLLKDWGEYVIILSLSLSQIYSWERSFSLYSKTSSVYYLPIIIKIYVFIFSKIQAFPFFSLSQKEEKCMEDMFLIEA